MQNGPFLSDTPPAVIHETGRSRTREGNGMVSEGATSMGPHCQQTISRIVPSETECTRSALGSETIERALRCFRADGVLIIEDIIDVAIIAEARRAFCETYSRYLDGSEHEDALKVGDRRLLITVNLEPPFGHPQLFANPHLLP